jgi:hypothetical protein
MRLHLNSRIGIGCVGITIPGGSARQGNEFVVNGHGVLLPVNLTEELVEVAIAPLGIKKLLIKQNLSIRQIQIDDRTESILVIPVLIEESQLLFHSLRLSFNRMLNPDVRLTAEPHNLKPTD